MSLLIDNKLILCRIKQSTKWNCSELDYTFSWPWPVAWPMCTAPPEQSAPGSQLFLPQSVPYRFQLPKLSLRICFLPADQIILLVMTLFPNCVMSWFIPLPYHLGRFTENAVWRNETKSCNWAWVRQVLSLCPSTQTKLLVLEDCDIGLWLLKEHHRNRTFTWRADISGSS